MGKLTVEQVNQWMSRGYLTYGRYEELLSQARKEEKEDVNNEEM